MPEKDLDKRTPPPLPIIPDSLFGIPFLVPYQTPLKNPPPLTPNDWGKKLGSTLRGPQVAGDVIDISEQLRREQMINDERYHGSRVAPTNPSTGPSAPVIDIRTGRPVDPRRLGDVGGQLRGRNYG